MFRRVITFFLFLFFSVCFSQGESNIWYFGNKAGMDFTSGSPVPLTNGQIDTVEGCATISNSAGQLLFYTDGIKVWNRNHIVMPNGSGLLGDPSSTQSAIIVPKPDSSTIYYIITCTDYEHSDGVNYSEVDMSLSGGFGAVTANKNINLVAGEVCEKLTAVKHGNGNDFWVMVHGFNNNTFYTFKITSLGVDVVPILNNIGATVSINADKTGYLKFSPDGTKLACLHGVKGIELFDFNSNTGLLSNLNTISPPDTGYLWYGVEFSPNTNVLYATRMIALADYNFAQSEILQYNLMASNILSSEIILYSTIEASTLYRIGALQLAPDSKIYLSITINYNSPIISVINNPNALGTSCNLNLNYLNLSPGTVRLGLPQFIQSYFNASFAAQNFCFGSTTQFTLNSSSAPTSILWDFGDGTTSTDVNPTHLYAAIGNYTVTVTATVDGETSTKSKTITISEVPVVANSVSNQTLCGVANQNYDLSQFNTTILGTQSSSIFGVAYFSSMENALNNNSALNAIQNLPLGTSTFYAKIYNLANNSCHAITSFTVTLFQQPVANTLTDYVICENLPYDSVEQFNLTTKNAQLLGSQTASNYTVSYHATQLDADNDVSQIPFLYTNTFQQETLYARIENNLNPNCFATTTLIIKVIQQPTLSAVANYLICDDSTNDGISLFDLSTKTNEILNGQSPLIFQVNYYYNFLDAQNGTNTILNPINNSVNNQDIYYSISAIGNSNCKVISSFKLVVSNQPIANPSSAILICDDISNNGKEIFNLSLNNSTILGSQNSNNYTISYHFNQVEADANINSLTVNYENVVNPQNIFVRIQNIQNPTCYTTTSFQIEVSKMPVANSVTDMMICDASNDGIEVFDLSTKTANILGIQSPLDFNITYHNSLSSAQSDINSLPLSYSNTSNPQIIYARIENTLNNSCYDITTFKIIPVQEPQFTMNDSYSICEGTSINISAPSGFSSYLWSNGDTTQTTTITQEGNYSLTVFENHASVICSTTKGFTVYNSNVATITNIVISDWTDENNSIIIYATGDGDYEYSLNNLNFQDSNQFSGLTSGQYNIFVRDKKGCGTATEEVFLLMYPKFFTPNSDNINDYWKIKFSRQEPNLEIKIFDRYGKFIKKLDAQNVGWDGTYNGYLLPSDDYWFIVTRENGKEYKGHFAMKR